MNVILSTDLDAPAAVVWREVCTPRLLRYVAAPLQTFVPLQPPVWPEVWREGAYQVQLQLLGVFSLGPHWIVLSFPAEGQTSGRGQFELRDRGHGRLVRIWDHLITVQALPGDRARYTDRVEVHAGVLTPFIWLFAQGFYRHRQRRWRLLVRRRFQFPGG